jgi:CheY-like chemotaxis protein
MRILLVDDDKDVRDAVCRGLSFRDHVVTEAADGLEAAALLKQQGFDCVVTDYFMPRMDGVDLALLANELAIPVVMVSGSETVRAIIAKRKAAVRLVMKPCAMSEIEAAVQEVAG